MELEQGKEFIEFLSAFVSDHKKERIEEVLANRTRFITIVLEDIFQSHNASAVIRTCECLGIQDIHIIEQRNTYNTNKDVLSGAGKWVNLFRYNSDLSTRDCFNFLQEKGYTIIGASPDSSNTLDDLDLNNKLAVVFGTELAGLSGYALKNVDGLVKTPMVGFTESLNLSVSAALIMNNLVHKLRSDRQGWELSKEEQEEIRLQWYLKVVKNPEKLEKEFRRLNAKKN